MKDTLELTERVAIELKEIVLAGNMPNITSIKELSKQKVLNETVILIEVEFDTTSHLCQAVSAATYLAAMRINLNHLP